MAIDPNLITTQRVGELPVNTLSLTSKIPHEVGTVLSQATIQDLVTFLQPYMNAFQFEKKILVVDAQYIIDNFDETGLGKNICIGWAIMNGQNGTDNVDGMMSIAYGATRNVIGLTGGSPDAVVVAHTHTSLGNTNLNFGTGDGISRQRAGVISGGVGDNVNVTVNSTGVSGAGKNMPPFVVDLHIMKL